MCGRVAFENSFNKIKLPSLSKITTSSFPLGSSNLTSLVFRPHLALLAFSPTSSQTATLFEHVPEHYVTCRSRFSRGPQSDVDPFIAATTDKPSKSCMTRVTRNFWLLPLYPPKLFWFYTSVPLVTRPTTSANVFFFFLIFPFIWGTDKGYIYEIWIWNHHSNLKISIFFFLFSFFFMYKFMNGDAIDDGRGARRWSWTDGRAGNGPANGNG